MTTLQIDLEKLRYPIGKFTSPPSVADDDIERWKSTIEKYPAIVRDAVASLSDAQLDTQYRDGGWTLRQVVHHVADSHMNAYTRFKLALTEDNPTIRPYHEDRWAELPDSKTAPIGASLDMLEAVHNRWVTVLKNMSEADYKKTFFHPESKVTRSLEVVLCLYDWHCKHHLAHITELKKKRNW